MSPKLAQGLGECKGVLHGLDVGRAGSISVICDIIATPPGADPPSWESIKAACNRADALQEPPFIATPPGADPPSWESIKAACNRADALQKPLEPLTATQLAVAAQPLQYEATGGRSGIAERNAARGRASGGVPKKGNKAKGVANTGDAAKGVPKKGNKASGMTHTGESKEDLLRRMRELPKG